LLQFTRFRFCHLAVSLGELAAQITHLSQFGVVLKNG
jgi:hypothetical protein